MPILRPTNNNKTEQIDIKRNETILSSTIPITIKVSYDEFENSPGNEFNSNLKKVHNTHNSSSSIDLGNNNEKSHQTIIPYWSGKNICGLTGQSP